ncbi:RagB/SusD family nutrient uptake outer membrane protein [Pedobacter nyackensis]|uniref:Starch-binding associating with outer membrane n=1 Tax=Pedobacter nyackensis TaxID=475255 RepID=A0A1W2BAY9_9SPHI|nr:RagB/SusD family nutrient uptake outer membrane protein [Pedobacter nyackensis]SMC69538.1 Starch-binding associating with outer membrane [Pedobacter nyackensis]
MDRYLSKIYKTLIAGMIIITGGCGKGFVDLIPDHVIDIGRYYKTESDIRAVLTGAYGNLREIYGAYWLYTELPSDNTQVFSENEGGQGEFDWLTYRSTGGVSGPWNQSYRTIAASNIILERIETITIADALKKQYIGEAKFLRALMYFNLVKFYGDVPLVLKELKTEEEAYTYKRSSSADVYLQIEKDLKEAQNLLPPKFTGVNIGRATSGAVKSLLGKVYVQQKKWIDAEDILEEVIPAYIFEPNLSKLFGPGNDNNSEVIFSAQYMSGGLGLGNSFALAFAPSKSGSSIVSQGASSFNTGTQDLYDAFETADLRKTAYLGVFKDGANPKIYYWARKFVYNAPILNDGDNDWPVLRYSDVLLLYAEALNQNDKTNDALTYISKTRVRANLPALSGLSKADTQLAIEKERRLELCFEGHRWHDLIRWGKEVATMQAYKTKYLSIDPRLSNMSITADRKLFPVPYREINLNPLLQPQNPGY